MGIAVVVVLVVVAIAPVLLFNGLVQARNRVDEGWAQIDVQLRRRHDLVPNLVETVKAYAAHERATLVAVTEARDAAMRADAPRSVAAAEERLDARLKTLFALAEGYPDLKASASFLELQRELTTTEDRIAYSRQYYNSAVRAYDDRRQAFPSNLVASMGDFPDREYYDPGEDVSDAPTLSW